MTILPKIRALRHVLRYVRREIHAKLDPIGYARSIGVTMGENVHFYGMPSGMFSTEP